jgi:hypothetical protein
LLLSESLIELDDLESSIYIILGGRTASMDQTKRCPTPASKTFEVDARSEILEANYGDLVMYNLTYRTQNYKLPNR